MIDIKTEKGETSVKLNGGFFDVLADAVVLNNCIFKTVEEKFGNQIAKTFKLSVLTLLKDLHADYNDLENYYANSGSGETPPN